MDYRTNKILNMLIYQENVDLQELKDVLNLSERMIRKTIKEFNDDLFENNICRIKIDPNNKIYLTDRSKEEIEKVRQFIRNNDFYTYRLTPNERKTILAMILLNAKGFSTAEKLSEHLIISRNTVINDLKELKEWFSNNDLELKSYVQKGYIVDGSELKIRRGMKKLLELNVNYNRYSLDYVDEVFQYRLLEILKYDKRADIIKEIIKQEEVRNNIHFSDYSFRSLLGDLLIITERLYNDKKLDIEIGNNITNSSKYPLSKGILTKIEEAFGIYVPETEKKYFVRILRKKSYIKSSTQNVDEMIIPFLIGECIHRITDCLGLNFYLDFNLYDVLVDHMKSVIYRTRNKEYLKNPFTGEIEDKYPELFTVICRFLKPIEEYIGERFIKDEIAFLVMYFASMREKDQLEKNKKRRIRVVLLGDMGRGAMQLMCARLETLRDVIEVLGVKSIHEKKEILPEDIDMIISTVRYSNEQIPYILVQSPVLKDSEIEQIRTMAIQLINKSEPKEEIVLDLNNSQLELKKIENSFISKDRILLDAEAENWEVAVRISGELLYETGMIKKEYIQSMIDNIKRNGSYIVICKGLAIPHGEVEQGVIQEGASIVRLKEPVCFGNMDNDPVHYVVGLCVHNSNHINTLIYNLVRIFSSKGFLDKMKLAKTREELFQLLKDKL